MRALVGVRAADGAAVAGDTIVVEPGTYTLDATLGLAASGTAAAPITLRGEGATLVSETVEALKCPGPDVLTSSTAPYPRDGNQFTRHGLA